MKLSDAVNRPPAPSRAEPVARQAKKHVGSYVDRRRL